MSTTTKLLNAQQAADKIGLKKATFLRYVSDGAIKVSERRGRAVFFEPQEIERYRKDGYTKSKKRAKVATDNPKRIIKRQPKLSEVERNRQKLASIAKDAKSAIVLNRKGEEVGRVKRWKR